MCIKHYLQYIIKKATDIQLKALIKYTPFEVPGPRLQTTFLFQEGSSFEYSLLTRC